MTEHDEDQVDEETRPAQTVLELPEYHGTPPVGMKTSLTGVGKRITRSHELDEKIVLLVEARVKSAAHESTDDGILYVEKLKTEDLFEVTGETGRRLLAQIRQAYRSGDDAASGRKALELGSIDLTDAGVPVLADGETGVALTPDEIAEIRKNDPLAAAQRDDLRPAVIVFSDNSRDLWPDEYEKDEPRPKAGDRFEDSDPDSPTGWIFVRQVLHAETGETLEEWTDDQENARLEALEKELEAKEASDGLPASPEFDVDGAGADGPSDVPTDAPDDEVEFVVDEEGFAEPVDQEPAEAPESDGNVVPLRRSSEAENAPETSTGSDDGHSWSEEALAKAYAFVDRNAPEILADVAEISSADELRLYLAGEEAGRGRGLKPRKGVLEGITKRLEELFLEADAPTPPPAEADDLVPADDEEPF